VLDSQFTYNLRIQGYYKLTTKSERLISANTYSNVF